MGIQETPLQKPYELSVGTKSHTVDLTAANRELDWLGISLVYSKSNKHLTVDDSYNAEVAFTFIKDMSIKNFTNTYSVYNELKFDTKDATEKYMLYNQFVAGSFKSCSIAPRSDYANNPIYQELSTEDELFTSAHLRDSAELRRNDGDFILKMNLKNAPTKR